MKSARRRSRELALQGLYQWQMNRCDCSVLLGQLALQPHFLRADRGFLERLLHGVLDHHEALDARLTPFLDRPAAQLSPVERAILWIGAVEFRDFPETPFRVILNEAIDLAKGFGGTEGHRYVNGVLDRLAALERPGERVPVRAPAE
ncbi:MAG: transcription antitermination factor NusB [Betaproteobacteria bacterium]|jgi:NusB antitermination factor|nr:transcription antitermination factor NusB [Betaproteobacteria bacterium]